MKIFCRYLRYATRGLSLLLTLLLTLLTAPAWPGKERPSSPPPTAAAAPAGEIILSGKIFCSLSRAVPLPFQGVITALPVQAGQRVAPGEVLARYRLTPEAALQIQRRLSPPQIKDLEAKQAELERNLRQLQDRQSSARQLAREKLAAPQTLAQLDREVKLVAQQRAAVQENLRRERLLAQEDRALLQKLLGQPLAPGRLPQEAALIAPIDGYVTWIMPELRQGAELPPASAAFQVGVMDPMLIRAQVHEIEAMQLALGDRAEVVVESLPGRKFPARVSRLPWAPLPTGLDQPSYYIVEFEVANPDLVLKEGLKARLVLNKGK